MYRNPRVLDFGGIWFVLRYGKDDTVVIGMEEHDWREGGGTDKPDEYTTWEDYFVARVKYRVPGDGVEQTARDFLASNEERKVAR